MDASIPETMSAAVIDRFGGPEEFHLQALPVPVPKRNEVLIRLESAGIGAWDPAVRAGELKVAEDHFPEVIGNDGAGRVVAVGEGVTRFRPGDRVYAFSMAGGFYAEFLAGKEDNVAPMPRGMDPVEAGALGADGITALRGIEDQLALRPRETIAIFGASGGVGHLAVQLASRKHARVIAVASGPDGANLVKRLGADLALDGRRDDVGGAIRKFAPGGIDAALVLAGGFDDALATLKPDGRVAYPNGVDPEPKPPRGIAAHGYDGVPTRDAFERLNQLVEPGGFHVELGRIYQLGQAGEAHRHVEQHHLGKLAFRVGSA
jgi:NADPH:quinone reductase